jgi:argininosuccinate lyase
MEKLTGFAINTIASTLSKFAMDVCLYAGQNFEFLKVDPAYTTGSSIMPHKKNPDGFELVRGKCNQLQALPYELNLILANLPSGYHRDLQVLKEHFIPAILSLKDCLIIATAMTRGLTVSKELINQSKYDSIFSVEEVNKLVIEGVPFRDAYHVVSDKINNGQFLADRKIHHTHVGSIGNLRNDLLEKAFLEEMSFFQKC